MRATAKRVGRLLCVTGKYFPRYAKSPASVSSEPRDGTAAKTNREEKRRAAARRGRRGKRRRGEGQREIYPCGNIARVHTWPRAVRQLRLQTLRRRQGMKRGGKTSAENRCGASRLSRARTREKERGVQGEVREGLDAAISVTYFVLRRFQRRPTLEIE